MSRKADRLAAIEAALDAVVAAAGANADEAAQRQDEIVRRLDSLDGTVADLAEAVRVVMAARKARDDAAPDLSGLLTEIRAVRALVTPAQPVPETQLLKAPQAPGSAGTGGQQPSGMGSRITPKRPPGSRT